MALIGDQRGRGEATSPWLVPAITDPDAVVEPDPPAEVERDTRVAATPPDTVTPSTTLRPGGRHQFSWVAAHGGAGATSLARATGTGGDLTVLWPSPALGWPAAVALVCRGNAAGLDAAAGMIREAVSARVPDVEVVALVVVADSPSKLTKALKARRHELSGTVPRLLEIPWIPSWRDDPYTPHPAATRVAETLLTLTTKEK